jgi:fructosamine-3-kinase
MDPVLRQVLTDLLGAAPHSAVPVSGGDIGASCRVELDDGARYFVKRYEDGRASMARAEAEGLRWLDEARAVRVARVAEVHDASPCVIVLEWIESRPSVSGFDEELGRSLAALHRSGAPGFGFEADNFIGRLPQSNRAHTSWEEFYAQERIRPQLHLARRSGAFSAALAARLESLLSKLPELCGPPEPPARLHGDLWGGNLMVDGEGRPCLIDPAVYGGHREMDLAMMQLFGGFSSRVFDAYREAAPLAPGYEERVPLCQLYPMLVHVNLFGGGYAGSVERIVGHYA